MKLYSKKNVMKNNIFERLCIVVDMVIIFDIIDINRLIGLFKCWIRVFDIIFCFIKIFGIGYI